MKRIRLLAIVAAALLAVACYAVLPAGPEAALPSATRQAPTASGTPPVPSGPIPQHTPVLRPSLTAVPTPTPQPGPTLTGFPSATALPSPTVEVTPSLTPVPTRTACPSAEPTSTPTITPEPTVTIREERITIATYQYQQALYTEAGFPYPRLDRSRVGPAVPATYELIVLENECLRVSVLPKLGGRVYQCVHIPTGQPIFYNNAVIKPTHWGPVEMGWWLAAGGIEWAVPVEEHGYLSGEPWGYAAERLDGDGAAIAVESVEKTRQLRVSVTISLLPKGCEFEIAPRIENGGEQAQSYQFWLNAMLAPGGDVPAETHFVMPAQRAIVHSSGDSSLPPPGGTVPWPQYGGLATYVNWPASWLGLFFAPLVGEIAEVRNERAGIGLRREFDARVTPGLKLFAFGTGFDPSTYTDDRSRYVELWGGVTRDFSTYSVLEPGQVLTWSERWQVVTLED